MYTPALPLTPHPECLVSAGAGHQPLLVTLVTYPHLKYRALIGHLMTILSSHWLSYDYTELLIGCLMTILSPHWLSYDNVELLIGPHIINTGF